MRPALPTLLPPLLLVPALLLSACKAAPDGAADDAKAAAPVRFEQLEGEPGRFVDAQGRISVPVPAGDGWECLDEQHGDAQAAAIAVRCRRSNPREFLFLAAKTHRQPRDQRVDAETVLMSLYRADNEAFFERVEYLSSQAANLAGAAGWEAELLAEHAKLGAIHKRERLAIVGDRVLAISAEGSPALWEQHGAAIEQWFAGVRFAGPQ